MMMVMHLWMKIVFALLRIFGSTKSTPVTCFAARAFCTVAMLLCLGRGLKLLLGSLHLIYCNWSFDKEVVQLLESWCEWRANSRNGCCLILIVSRFSRDERVSFFVGYHKWRILYGSTTGGIWWACWVALLSFEACHVLRWIWFSNLGLRYTLWNIYYNLYNLLILVYFF